MSQYRKPKWIRITLWLMLAGMIIASVIGVIAPYLPTASDDIATMTQDINADTIDTTEQLNPNSILNQFQDTGAIVSGDAITGSAVLEDEAITLSGDVTASGEVSAE